MMHWTIRLLLLLRHLWLMFPFSQFGQLRFEHCSQPVVRSNQSFQDLSKKILVRETFVFHFYHGGLRSP
jgi:hypothetical protein